MAQKMVLLYAGKYYDSNSVGNGVSFLAYCGSAKTQATLVQAVESFYTTGDSVY